LAELCTLIHTSLISLNHSRFCLSRLVVCIRCCRNVGLIAYKRLVVSRRKLNEVVERSRIGAERSHCSVKCERCQWGYISIGFLLSPFAYSLSFSLSPKWWKKDCRETRAMGPWDHSLVESCGSRQPSRWDNETMKGLSNQRSLCRNTRTKKDKDKVR
jgi:hypothetical protein